KNGQQFTGGAIASPVWTKFMIEAHKGLPVLDFEKPEGVVFYNVDKETGLLGGDFPEAFLAGTSPPTEIPAFREGNALEQRMESQVLDDIRL
ncbi:MAG: hypothetical protein JXR94_15100, partial [Candidatus Hydrogenedentes bacterium]|nr:hypothetical protein [Candidatus Hydrogenedentota bacterium]